ncbi:MAG: cell division protein FtsA [Longimicrobiales bacterium]
MRPGLVVGLDIGSTKTCAVIAEVGGDARRGPLAKVLGVGQARTGGIRRDVVTDIEETTQSIRKAMKEAELMAGVSVDRVFIGVSGEHIDAAVSTGVVAVGGDEIKAPDIQRVHEVARAVVVPSDRELLHVLPQEYTVDHRKGIHDPVGMVGTRLEAEVYMVTSSTVAGQTLRKAADRAGYKVEAFVHEELAASLAVLSDDEKEVGVALVDLGGGSTEVAGFVDGKARHLASIPWGGAAVTNDLTKGLQISFAEAERTKERYGVAFAQLVDPRESVELPGPAAGQVRSVQRELIAHIIEQRLDEIMGLAARELEQSLDPRKLGAGVVLVGGGAVMNGVVDVAQHVFGMPVRIGTPGDRLTGLADSVRKPRFTTAVGLTLYGAQRRLRDGAVGARGEGALERMVAWLKEFF